MVERRDNIQMEIAGNTAMWTRPDTGDCPVSYPAPTYSAVKAIFESVLLGFKSVVIPTQIEICAPLQYHTYHTNYGGPLRKSDSVTGGNSFQLLATTLIDVCYRLYAEVVVNKERERSAENYDGKKLLAERHALNLKKSRAKRGKGTITSEELQRIEELNRMLTTIETPPKNDAAKTLSWDARTTSPAHAYQAIFERRLQRGQCYALPFLGWKEFTPSYFGKFRESTQVLDNFSTTIPSMLRQVFPNGYNSEQSYVYDQDVRIENGVLRFGDKEEAEND
ncbi:type I-C CRISPR-associated protein Cas5 [Planctomycetales bacterium]|nr:type I-C CRISPR-associated protein Cas5 [Planctomycetales bacterium]GHT04435.1 type I-C CRISPR-associated protein Cas5 [Planctomycetales bacterium]